MTTPPPEIPLSTGRKRSGVAVLPGMNAGYWRRRLVRRRPVELPRPEIANEWFARIEHAGDWAFFPLGSDVAATAAQKACEIYSTIVTQGWPAARRNFVREFTVALFWLPNPLAATYATLFTQPGTVDAGNSAPANSPGNLKVALIEPAEEIRHAMKDLLNSIDGSRCVAALASPRELKRIPTQNRADVVLFNQHGPPAETSAWLHRVRSEWPEAMCVPYGIYRNSDELFVSITGVDGGYFLRRRAPDKLLEPMQRSELKTEAGASTAPARARDYFTELIRTSADNSESAAATMLTNREYEILTRVSRGVTSNKAIAGALQISAWTVSTHLKSIFRKLNVHSRTEAVMKFIQR